MHLVLAFLGTVVTILVLVKKLSDSGIDFGWLNPFLWHRRKSWRDTVNKNPIFCLENPMEVAAILVTALAKSDGDMSHEEKQTILSMFESEFGLDEVGAAELLRSSIFMYENGTDINSNIEKVLSPSLEHFSQEQAKSVIELLTKVSDVDSNTRRVKLNFIKQVHSIFDEHFRPKEKWE